MKEFLSDYYFIEVQDGWGNWNSFDEEWNRGGILEIQELYDELVLTYSELGKRVRVIHVTREVEWTSR